MANSGGDAIMALDAKHNHVGNTFFAPVVVVPMMQF